MDFKNEKQLGIMGFTWIHMVTTLNHKVRNQEIKDLETVLICSVQKKLILGVSLGVQCLSDPLTIFKMVSGSSVFTEAL